MDATSKPRILYVDDEEDNLKTFSLVFESYYQIITFNNPFPAIDYLRSAENKLNPVKTIISDQRMPKMSGTEFLEVVKKDLPDVPAIILTGYTSEELLMQAINELHLYSFVSKPWYFDSFKNLIDNAISHYELIVLNKQLMNDLRSANNELKGALTEINALKTQLEAENEYLRQEYKEGTNPAGIITQNKEFQQLLATLETIAQSDSTVLITGETGTGKELLTQALHELGPRKDKPIIRINCAAIPENLIESELFGYEKGAFTGAVSRKIGRFELAHGGTLFLDEIGEMPLDLQSKLLRVLQEEEFERVGGLKTIKVDFRLVVATNKNLEMEVKNGSFRADLFYRLNVIPIEIPPLRQRRNDVQLLANHFNQKFSSKYGKKIIALPTEAIRELESYSWPGNIRELENIIERAVITSPAGKLKIDPSWLSNISEVDDKEIPTLEENERRLIIKALQLTDGMIHGKHGAAHILDINPSTLRSRIQKLGINISKIISK